MAGNKLVSTLQKIAKPNVQELTNLLYGTITSIAPLKIKVDNRFEITEEFIVLSTLCKETYAQPIDNGTKLWRGLALGDVVRILRVNQGQLYYVLERDKFDNEILDPPTKYPIY